MEPAQEGYIPLLREIVDLIIIGTSYFAAEETSRARKAIRKLKRKSPDDGAFFSILYVDVQELASVSKDVPESWTDGQGPGQKAILRMLDVVQASYMKVYQTDDDDDSDDEKSPTVSNDSYAKLKSLVRRFNDKDDGPEETEHQISWLCEKLKFEETTPEIRKALLESVKQCSNVLKSILKTSSTDVSFIRAVDPSTALWTTPFFEQAEEFHEALDDEWDCACFEDHLHMKALFSFDQAAEAQPKTTSGVMLFHHEKEGAMFYKLARYEHEKTKKLTATLDPDINNDSRHDRFCACLEQCDANHLIHFDGGSTNLTKRTRHDNGGINAMIPQLSETSPLTACFNIDEGHVIYQMTDKRRMMLALFLVYAYLHFGGKAWWPYERKSSVQFANQMEHDGSVTTFFAASLVSDDSSKFEFICKKSNPAMPSIIALGRLLLSLFVGHHVTWDKFETELRDCAEDVFASEKVRAVDTCMHLCETTTVTGTPTIKDDETLRNRFINDVVLPIQYILQHGYKVQARDIFTPPALPQIVEMPTPRRIRTPAPIAVDGPQQIPDGFCLCDGKDLEELTGKDANSADGHMTRLKATITSTLKRLPKAPTDVKGPVKICVIDTGADIDPVTLEMVYDDRVKEVRTWLLSRKEEGDVLQDESGNRPRKHSLDHDGHGTHGTDVVLDATTDTDIEVYVAQVFRGSNDSLVKDQIMDNYTVNRIVNAINYAVNTWKVDIISMSFGFPDVVPEVEEAIENANLNSVLMLAAASNCGGNDRRSWPAKDDRVMCIYATDGVGNKYYRNPGPMRNQYNFASLGVAVKAFCPPESEGKPGVKARRSGTSTATPIAAAIAALVLSTMRRCEKDYLLETSKPGHSEEDLRREYRKRTGYLGRAARMNKVFNLMLGEQDARDGYLYITPWSLFRKELTGKALADAILDSD